MSEERVILVDSEDNEIGTAEKLSAHRDGLLHRAISVFVMNEAGEMLLQRRADGKYHSAGLWSNTCCSHPRPGEQPIDAARRRLREEMGISCELRPAFSFTYRADFDSGLTEHELDHVFVGTVAESEREGARPAPHPEEVSDWRWIGLPDLERELAEDPTRFTVWFPLALRRLLA
jgi:isopentenyl-diphosphate Delta-isomerase